MLVGTERYKIHASLMNGLCHSARIDGAKVFGQKKSFDILSKELLIFKKS